MDKTAIALLRSLKGPAISILTAMVLEQEPIGHDYLVRVTGWSKDKVTDGLQTLHDLELIEQLPGQRYNGWVLTDRCNQLSIFSSPKISDSILTTTELNKEKINNISSSSRALESEKIGLANLTSEKLEVQKLLHTAGIMGITSARLANTPHVTLEYARAHIQRARKERTPTGILITRLRDNDPIETISDEIRTPEYLGEYADYINH